LIQKGFFLSWARVCQSNIEGGAKGRVGKGKLAGPIRISRGKGNEVIQLAEKEIRLAGREKTGQVLNGGGKKNQTGMELLTVSSKATKNFCQYMKGILDKRGFAAKSDKNISQDLIT